MHTTKFIIIFITALAISFSACKNQAEKPLNPANLSVNTSKQQAQAHNSQFLIYKTLAEINNAPLPKIIYQYFHGNNNIAAKVLDNTTIQFISKIDNSGSLVQVKLLKNDKKQTFLFINAVKHYKFSYQNYFYILQKADPNHFINISLDIIPNDVLQIIHLALDEDIKFQKLSNFWAFLTSPGQNALQFEFNRNIAIVYRCYFQKLNDKCKPFLKLKWNGQGFYYSLIENNKNPKLLTEQQLDQVQRFTDLSEALDNPQQVYILDLEDAGIKSLPQSIGLLTNLQVLILNDNFLDSIPSSIGKLTNLQILRAENNNLKTLPASIGNLTNLEEIALANNKISWLPYSFRHLVNLEKLDLSNNRLSVIAFSMKNMNNLVSVDLSKNKFSKVPYQIFNLKNLKYLDLSYNPINVLPKEFINMKSLQYLILVHTKIDSSQILFIKQKRPDLQIVY